MPDEAPVTRTTYPSTLLHGVVLTVVPGPAVVIAEAIATSLSRS
jgi:hypothetical protein